MVSGIEKVDLLKYGMIKMEIYGVKNIGLMERKLLMNFKY